MNCCTFGGRFRRFAAILVVAVVWPTLSFAGELLFKDARIFDGSQVVAGTSVLVVDGVIRKIGEALEHDDATVIECAGQTLMPGLIDCHVHAFSVDALQQAACFGVTTVLDMMSVPRMAAVFRRQQAAGKTNDRADFFSAGAAVTVAKGHGTQFGFPVPTLAGAADAQAFVDARIEEGSDYIKLIYDDGAAFGMRFPTLSVDMLQASVAATHDRNKLAVAHIGSLQGAKDALGADVDGLVHVFGDEQADQELLDTTNHRKRFVVPTAAVMRAIVREDSTAQLEADERLRPFLSQRNLAELQRRFPKRQGVSLQFESVLHNIKTLADAGVTILAGTDAPNPGTTHGASLHHELALLVDAGLSPAQALAGATSLAADSFQLSDRGRIAVGLRADLLLVAGDPLEDIRNTRSIVGVWKAGVPIDREKRRQRVEPQPTEDAAGKDGAGN